jgi:hypothetical protein
LPRIGTEHQLTDARRKKYLIDDLLADVLFIDGRPETDISALYNLVKKKPPYDVGGLVAR